MKQQKERARCFMLLLYPEDATHAAAVEKIKQSYDYAFIVHDKDTWTAEDEQSNPEHKEGTIKKLHIHCVLRFKNAKWSSAVAKELGIADNYVQVSRNIDNSLAYLVHFNDEDKAQYRIEDVVGTMAPKLKEIVNKSQKTEGEKVVELLEVLDKIEGYVSVRDFAGYCAENGYWSEFRRSGSIFLKILEEHNAKYKNEN